MGPIIKPKVFRNDEPLRRNTPTVEGLVIQDERDLAKERARLYRFDRPVCSRRAQGLHHTSAQLLWATDAGGVGDPDVQASGSSFAAVWGLENRIGENHEISVRCLS